MIKSICFIVNLFLRDNLIILLVFENLLKIVVSSLDKFNDLRNGKSEILIEYKLSNVFKN